LKIFVPAAAEEVVTSLDILGEVAIAALLLTTLVGLHGLGLTYASARFSRRLARMNDKTPLWRVHWVMTVTVGSFVLIHLAECIIWAIPIYWLGIVHSYHSAFAFVFECYTTLGLTVVIVPQKYDLLPPMIAVTGLFTFGWTGSSLVYVMSQILRLESNRILHHLGKRRHHDEDAPGPFGL
jgi:hypothetical protein